MRLAEKMRAILKKTSQINSLKLFRSNKLLKYAIMSTFFVLKFGLENICSCYYQAASGFASLRLGEKNLARAKPYASLAQIPCVNCVRDVKGLVRNKV